MVMKDLKTLGVDENMTMDGRSWRKIIVVLTPNLKTENIDYKRKR